MAAIVTDHTSAPSGAWTIREQAIRLCEEASERNIQYAREEANNAYEAHAHLAAAHQARMLRDAIEALPEAASAIPVDEP